MGKGKVIRNIAIALVLIILLIIFVANVIIPDDVYEEDEEEKSGETQPPVEEKPMPDLGTSPIGNRDKILNRLDNLDDTANSICKKSGREGSMDSSYCDSGKDRNDRDQEGGFSFCALYDYNVPDNKWYNNPLMKESCKLTGDHYAKWANKNGQLDELPNTKSHYAATAFGVEVFSEMVRVSCVDTPFLDSSTCNNWEKGVKRLGDKFVNTQSDGSSWSLSRASYFGNQVMCGALGVYRVGRLTGEQKYFDYSKNAVDALLKYEDDGAWLERSGVYKKNGIGGLDGNYQKLNLKCGVELHDLMAEDNHPSAPKLRKALDRSWDLYSGFTELTSEGFRLVDVIHTRIPSNLLMQCAGDFQVASIVDAKYNGHAARLAQDVKNRCGFGALSGNKLKRVDHGPNGVWARLAWDRPQMTPVEWQVEKPGPWTRTYDDTGLYSLRTPNGDTYYGSFGDADPTGGTASRKCDKDGNCKDISLGNKCESGKCINRENEARVQKSGNDLIFTGKMKNDNRQSGKSYTLKIDVNGNTVKAEIS